MASTSRSRFGRVLVAALGIGALVTSAVACSSSSTDSSSSGTERGGTLTLIQGTPPLSMNPAQSNNGPASQYIDVAYSSLLHWAADNTIEPALASGYRYIGQGNTKFEIDLRSNVKFSDGTSLDSSAVKKYLEYFENANGPFSATAKAVLGSIETPSPTQVILNFKVPDPDAPISFTEGNTWGTVISPKVIDSNPDSLGTTTAGAGPYMLDTAQTVTGSTYTYVKNPYYYAPAQQKWNKVVIKVIANTNSALQAVTTGSNTWMQGTMQQVATARASGLSVGLAVPAVYSLFITDRGGHVQPALGKLQVRQALNYAVDRSAIAGLMKGTANDQIIAKGFTGYSDAAAGAYGYDPAKARQLLAEAGYPNGFTFTVLIGTYDPDVPPIAQALAEQLSKVGVTMKIATATSFADFARQQGAKKFSADIEQWGSTTMYSVAQQLVLPTGVVNPWHDNDTDMTALYQKASTESGAQALADWQQLSQMVAQNAWYVPMVTVQMPFFSSTSINTLGDCKSYPNPLHF